MVRGMGVTVVVVVTLSAFTPDPSGDAE